MSPSERGELSAGRSAVQLAIGIMLGIEILVQALTDAAGAATPQKVVQQVIRFLIAAGLCYLMYQGHRWAKWVVVALLALGVVTGAVLLAQTGITVTMIPMILFVVAYGAALRILLWSRPANAFLEAQRSKE